MGEIYEIELMSEMEVAVADPNRDDCERLGVELSAVVGDTVRFEIVSLKYSEQLDCGEVRDIRIVAATPQSFQHLIGVEMSGGVAAADNLYYRVLGGDTYAPPSHPAATWSWGLVARGCAGVGDAFDPENPRLAFGIIHSTQLGYCTETWAAKLTRVTE